MQRQEEYHKKVFSIIQSLKFNLFTDYEGQLTNQNANHIISLYHHCYQEKNPQKRQILYQKLKSNIHDQNQLNILKWLEKERGQKYLGQSLPSAQKKKKYHSIKLCLNSDHLQQTRVIGLLKHIPILEKVLLDPVHISQSLFMIQTEPKYKKSCLFRKVKQRESRPTPWIVQKTKDHRYIWRASCGIDKNDVSNLLMFILIKRSQEDRCPSIFINTGSHGDYSGITCSDEGDFRLTAQFIYEQTLDTLYQIIQNYGPKLRLNQMNVRTKVCVYFMSSSCPNVYPDQADHIIDTQCFGAYRSIKAQRLHPPGTLIKQENLMFLEGKLQILYQKYKIFEKKLSTFLQSDYKTEKSIQNKPITKQIQKILSQSAIIKNQQDAHVLIKFFHFTYSSGLSKNDLYHKRLKDLNLIFRASQHEFKISEFFDICGNQTFTFFLCLTEKNKIIGAYSPFSHQYKVRPENDVIYEQGQWVKDPQKDSFIFSVTNNESFILNMPLNALYRKMIKDEMVFGCYDFSICDKANEIRQSKAINNWAYYNCNYLPPNQDEICIENCVRFNGNKDPHFLIKEWQVWKIQLQQYTPQQ